ncbi:hypothetical protein [Nocardia suismassiliense]|uniref:hypothetical protein n=1 Tax=Nocardia suismassiliense TaxID=2077092 RepID=UPI000D1E8D73|nr:hypothetical protein [Nocardia suismassiliense]
MGDDPAEAVEILLQLDAQLPSADPEVARLTEQIRAALDPVTLDAVVQAYRAGVLHLFELCVSASAGAAVTEHDIRYMYESVHAGLPAGLDRAVIAAMDERVARLICTIGTLASG